MPKKKNKPKGIVFIMRGLPGSGKSTVTDMLMGLASRAESVGICSADNYFCSSDGYTFNPNLLPQAHGECWDIFKGMVEYGTGVIIVDNTNVTRKSWKRYESHAKRKGYIVTTLTVEEWRPRTCFDRNAHGVPYKTIVKMKEGFER